MADAAFVIIAILAFAAWSSLVISGIRMLRHRRRSILWHAMNGWSFFWGDTFAPGAERDRRRLILSFGLFFLAIVAAMAAAVIRLA